MNKMELMKILNTSLKDKNIDFSLNGNQVDTLVLDITRVLDSRITIVINKFKKEYNLKLNSLQKEKFRRYFIGYPEDIKKYPCTLDFIITEDEIKEGYILISKGFNEKKSLMIESLIARVELNFLKNYSNTAINYEKYIKEIQTNMNQLLIIELNADKNYSTGEILKIIENNYTDISNFHYAIIIFKDGDNLFSWSQISKISLFMEHFKQEKNFNLFNKKNRDFRINELKEFIKENKNIKSNDLILKGIESFYENISYGFQFEDLYITDDGKNKILVMQKVELDENPKKCPACLKSLVRGNSYPKLLYKSFECQNPSCPSRSKIGRGKRYDIFTAKRQTMLDINSKNNIIDNDIYYTFRRDIINSSDKKLIQKLISLYSWDNDTIKIINSINFGNSYLGRNIIYKNIRFKDNSLPQIEDTKIYKLFYLIANNINYYDLDKKTPYENISDSFIYNGNSTDIIANIKNLTTISEIGGAVTSPPYYNAREYSQWKNLLFYLIDMMINAKSIFINLKKTGTYIYNIGDVLGQDNIYIHSLMSKRKQMLGFYSIFIFELIGFKILGNIVWDKGEVQSKRNCTPNHFPGYIKPINAYEHCLVFSKDNSKEIIPTEVRKIETVKKINSKGENVLGHSAPFPIDIAKLIIPYINKDDYIVDPFLGSGTTAIALNEDGYKVIGCELNRDYYNLALERISNYNTK